MPEGDDPRARAFVILTRDHIDSAKLGQVCQSLVYGGKENEAFLRALLEKSPRQDVRGQACLALARHLNNGGRGPADRKEAEELFQRAIAEYADVQAPPYGKIGDKAKAELFAVHHLALGQTAPDIEGADQDGKPFKLSDYKGKVVLLDFWSRF
jgi:hypothetical protein